MQLIIIINQSTDYYTPEIILIGLEIRKYKDV